LSTIRFNISRSTLQMKSCPGRSFFRANDSFSFILWGCEYSVFSTPARD
jgi:hypothetical protein